MVAYMLASGAEDGSLRIWDLRSFASGSHVSHFGFHRRAVTSVEWCPYEGSMLASSGADNQLAVRQIGGGAGKGRGAGDSLPCLGTRPALPVCLALAPSPQPAF
eukprot:364326-Chlamydomonas_euryale.AAC.15